MSTKISDKSDYSKNEVNVIISHACEEAVTYNLKVNASVKSKNKMYKVHFYADDYDHTLGKNDIEEQVEQLKLHRDPENNDCGSSF